MRPTRSGLVVLVSIPVLAALAWLFGQPELMVAAAAVTAGTIASVALVGTRPPRLEIRRSIHPPRVVVGESCHVRLTILNRGPRRSPVLGVRDEVGADGEVSMHVAPIGAGQHRDATYTLPTSRRGLHPIGPLTLRTEDPFGLVRRSTTVADTRVVIVLPSSSPLTPLAGAAGDEPEHGTRVLASSATVDEELASMRPYTVGDDIRRIHWRTTARIGQPVVRQYDQPWQRRTTLLLDVDAGATDPAAFERAVITTTSVVRRSAADGEMLRLVTTDGLDSGFVGAAEQLDALLDRLALVAPTDDASLARGLRVLGASSSGRLVVVGGRMSAAAGGAWDPATRRFGLRVLVSTTAAPVELASDRDAMVLSWDGRRSLTDVWTAAMAVAPGPRAERGPGRRVVIA